MTTVSTPNAKRSLFRVTFQGGTTVTTTAATSLLAERNAIRLHSGVVKEVRFLRSVHE